MWPDQVSNSGPLTNESGALPTALRGNYFISLSSVKTLLSTKYFMLKFAIYGKGGMIKLDYCWYNKVRLLLV